MFYGSQRGIQGRIAVQLYLYIKQYKGFMLNICYDFHELKFLRTIFLTFFFLRYILSPFGKSLGIKSTRSKRATPNTILEHAYNECSRLRHKTVSEIFHYGNGKLYYYIIINDNYRK